MEELELLTLGVKSPLLSRYYPLVNRATVYGWFWMGVFFSREIIRRVSGTTNNVHHFLTSYPCAPCCAPCVTVISAHNQPGASLCPGRTTQQAVSSSLMRRREPAPTLEGLGDRRNETQDGERLFWK